nr:heparinase [Sphingopyxis sp.]
MTSPPSSPIPDPGDDAPPLDDSIEPGKRLIRLPADKGLSLGDRIANQITRLTWRTPLHAFRLKGRFPLKLLGVPADPVPGDMRAGMAIRAGHFLHRGLKLRLGELDFATLGVAPAFADYLHSFAWLRDLAATGTRADGAPIAEAVVRQWLATHGEAVSEPAWQADNTGWRILFWAAHAPLILSSSDLIYRSAVLNHLARAARHLDRVADKTRPGTGQLVAWIGIVAAALLMPGGEPRQVFGEAGLRKVIETSFYADGGNIARSPQAQLDAVMALAM